MKLKKDGSGESVPVNENYINDNGVNIPMSKKKINKTSFEGSAYFNVIVMYFLSHKHPNCCVIYPNNYEADMDKNIHWFKDDHHEHDDSCVLLPRKLKHIPDEQTEVSLRWIQKKKKRSKKLKVITMDSYTSGDSSDGHISVPKNFWKKFQSCPSKRFVVFPFGYNCVDSGHANYMLYDRKLKVLSRFEPFGKVVSSCLNPPTLDKKIFELFVKNLGSDLIKEYYPPQAFLPTENFQTIQENEKEWINRNEDEEPVGYCSVWSAWFIDLRLSNPDMDKEELVKLAMKKLKSLKSEKGLTFTSFIRNYSGMIVEVSKEIKKIYDGK